MPADRRAGRVALYEDLDELFRLVASELGSVCAHGEEPVGDGLARLRRARLVVVVEPEMSRRAPRGLAADHDRVEPEGLENVEQRRLLVARNEIRPVDEPFRLLERRSRHHCVLHEASRGHDALAVVRVAQRHDLDVPAGLWRVDHPSVAEVEADVPQPRKEKDVARFDP